MKPPTQEETSGMNSTGNLGGEVRKAVLKYREGINTT